MLRDLKYFQARDPAIGNIIEKLSDEHADRTGISDAWTLRDGILLCRGLMYIPAYETLKVRVLQQAHDALEVGHPGQAKTLEVIQRNFYWPNMRTFINEYIRSCDACQRNKAAHHKPYGLLHPLPVPIGPWLSLSMDHIVDLPRSHGFNAVLVVVDRMTKMTHFIKSNTTDDARTLARQFLDNIFRVHGLPNDIVSDRGPTFASAWWTEFLKMLKVRPNLSTAFHPQSDGQTERVHQSLELHLRTFCEYLMTDWVDLLPLAEFAYNATHHSTIGMTPFYANFGYHPRMSLTSMDSPVPSVEKRMDQIDEAHEMAQRSIARALEQHTLWANKHRLPSPDFNPGDKVWLLRRNIRTARPSDKLDSKKLGPFEIERKIGQSAFRLLLPQSMRIHPTFHVSLLEKWYPNVHPERMDPVHPNPDVPGNEERFDIERILDSRFRRDVLQYFVKWKNYGADDNSWAVAADLPDDEPLVIDFHTTHPTKPGYERVRPRTRH